MTMRNFVVALAITALFLGVVLLAATMQNEGCPPWKEPVVVGGSGNAFAEHPGKKLCR
jgi:hypothetical protein